MPRVEYVDPELQFDVLPEPYRSIDEIVRNVIDSAWKGIRDRAMAPTIGRYRNVLRHARIDVEGQSWHLQAEDLMGGKTAAPHASPTALSVTKLSTQPSLPQFAVVGTLSGDILVVPRDSIRNSAVARIAAFRCVDPNSLTKAELPVPDDLQLSVHAIGTSSEVSNATAVDGASSSSDVGWTDTLRFDGGVSALPEVTVAPSGDHYHPLSANKRPGAASGEADDAAAALKRLNSKGKGVAFRSADDGAAAGGQHQQESDEDKMARRLGLSKPAAVVVPIWSEHESERGFLVVAAGTAVGTTANILGSAASVAAVAAATAAESVAIPKPSANTKTTAPPASQAAQSRTQSAAASGKKADTAAASDGGAGRAASAAASFAAATSKADQSALDKAPTAIRPTGVLRIFHVPSEALIPRTGLATPSYVASDGYDGAAAAWRRAGHGSNDQAPISAHGHRTHGAHSSSSSIGGDMLPVAGMPYVPPIRWLASATMPHGVTVSKLEVSMDGRYVSATGSDAVVRVYHLHCSVISPPPSQPPEENVALAMIKRTAGESVAGDDDDSDDEEGGDYESKEEEELDDELGSVGNNSISGIAEEKVDDDADKRVKTSKKQSQPTAGPASIPVRPPVELEPALVLAPPTQDPISALTSNIMDPLRAHAKALAALAPPPSTSAASSADGRPGSSGGLDASASSSGGSNDGKQGSGSGRAGSPPGRPGSAGGLPPKHPPGSPGRPDKRPPSSSGSSKTLGAANAAAAASSGAGASAEPPPVAAESAANSNVGTAALVPQVPVPLVIGFHFIATRIATSKPSNSGSNGAYDSDQHGADGGSSIAGGSRAPTGSIAGRGVSGSLAGGRTAGSRSRVGHGSAPPGAPKSSIARGSGKSVSIATTDTDAAQLAAPVIPKNYPGSDGIPVTTGVVVWWSVDATAPGGTSKQAQALQRSLQHVRRFPLNSLAAIDAPLQSGASAAATCDAISGSPLFTPLPFASTASAATPSLLCYAHNHVFESPHPSHASPLVVIGDESGTVTVYDVGASSPAIPRLNVARAGTAAAGAASTTAPTTGLSGGLPIAGAGPALGAMHPRVVLGHHTPAPSLRGALASESKEMAKSAGSLFDRKSDDASAAAVTSVAVSADGRWVVSGSRGGQVFVWDLQRALYPSQHHATNAVSMPSNQARDGSSNTAVAVSSKNNPLKGMSLIGGALHWNSSSGGSGGGHHSIVDQVLKLPSPLHAARWDGLGHIISIRMLTEAPIALVEAFEHPTDSRGRLVQPHLPSTSSDASSANAAAVEQHGARVIYAYDVPAGMLLCTVRPGGARASEHDSSSSSLHDAPDNISNGYEAAAREAMRVRSLVCANSSHGAPIASVAGASSALPVTASPLMFNASLTAAWHDGFAIVTQTPSSSTRNNAPALTFDLQAMHMRALLRVGYPVLGRALERAGINYRGTGVDSARSYNNILGGSGVDDADGGASRFVLHLYNALPQEERDVLRASGGISMVIGGNGSSGGGNGWSAEVDSKAQALLDRVNRMLSYETDDLRRQSAVAMHTQTGRRNSVTNANGGRRSSVSGKNSSMSLGMASNMSPIGAALATGRRGSTTGFSVSIGPPSGRSKGGASQFTGGGNRRGSTGPPMPGLGAAGAQVEAAAGLGDVFRPMGRPTAVSSAQGIPGIKPFIYASMPPAAVGGGGDGGEDEEAGTAFQPHKFSNASVAGPAELQAYYNSVRRTARGQRDARLGLRSKAMTALLQWEYAATRK